jgi:transcription antitermination factor NusG
LNLPGVIKFVSFEGVPVVIPDQEIDTIRKIMNYGGEICVEEFNEDIKEGDEVMISYGPFYGMKGTIVNRNGKQRLVVMLENFEKRVSVEFPSCLVEKVG